MLTKVKHFIYFRQKHINADANAWVRQFLNSSAWLDLHKDLLVYGIDIVFKVEDTEAMVGSDILKFKFYDANNPSDSIMIGISSFKALMILDEQIIKQVERISNRLTILKTHKPSDVTVICFLDDFQFIIYNANNFYTNGIFYSLNPIVMQFIKQYKKKVKLVYDIFGDENPNEYGYTNEKGPEHILLQYLSPYRISNFYPANNETTYQLEAVKDLEFSDTRDRCIKIGGLVEKIDDTHYVLKDEQFTNTLIVRMLIDEKVKTEPYLDHITLDFYKPIKKEEIRSIYKMTIRMV